MKAATIHEVAALAGVSHQTVSRFLNHDTGMRPATIVKVKNAMAELNYTPNLAARALRSRQNYRIVVVVPDASHYFPIRVLNGAARAAQRAGYRVDVMALEGTAEDRVTSLQTVLLGADVAGVLAFAPLPAPKPGDAASQRVPMVVAGAYDDNMRTHGSWADGTAEARIVAHLHGLGHRNFVHIAGPADYHSARNRRAAYEQAVKDLAVVSHGIVEGDWTSKSGYQAASEILRHPDVSAVVAANDGMAFGLLRALHERHIDVPGQLSVFGWDDMEHASYSTPTLSTVRMDMEAQGGTAMNRLIASIRGELPDAQDPSEPTMELIFRESIGPARTGPGGWDRQNS